MLAAEAAAAAETEASDALSCEVVATAAAEAMLDEAESAADDADEALDEILEAATDL